MQNSQSDLQLERIDSTDIRETLEQKKAFFSSEVNQFRSQKIARLRTIIGGI
jgi:hypothetical protein